MKKLAIITTHPIQYYAPVFKLLCERKKIEIKVLYTWSQASASKFDRDFGREIEWDIPLLEGYDYEFIKNVSPNPGVYSFFGLINPSLISKIESFNPDAILINGWNYLSHLRAMIHFKGRIPVYFRGDSTLLDQNNKLKKRVRKILLKWIYSFTDKAFYVGTNNKAYFLAAGLKEEQLVYAPHTVNNDFFKENEPYFEAQAENRRRELGIEPGDFVCLFAGKFEPKKNPELLINAFIHINLQINKSPNQQITTSPNQQISKSPNPQISKSPNPQIHLLLVGNGILENELHQMAAGNPLIHFLPFQNQSLMPLIYRMADVFCLPSMGPNETWGLAVNEAMACGRPAIVSDKVGCAVDLIKPGENGYIFNHSSQSDLEKCLSLAFQNRQALILNRPQIQEFIQSWSIRECAEKIENEISQSYFLN